MMRVAANTVQEHAAVHSSMCTSSPCPTPSAPHMFAGAEGPPAAAAAATATIITHIIAAGENVSAGADCACACLPAVMMAAQLIHVLQLLHL
jgi:hypothetical protein